MTGRLDGRVALVTGGGVGIGRGIALALADEGATVAVTHRTHTPDEELLERIGHAPDGSPLAFSLEATNEDEVARTIQAVVDATGSLEVLVNNVGGLIGRCDIGEFDLAMWREVFAVNVETTFLFTKHALPLLSDGGHIVNVSSVAGRNGGSRGVGAYAAAKAALFAFTRATAKEAAPRSITANAVAPGLILDTPFHETFTPEADQRAIIAGIPLGRPGYPADVAGAVTWLVSQESSYVTGTIIDVNGGQYFA
ncbi:SDR family NAD(P)-dependent oxidoreductase [Brooklawnia cerclae]|uniref:3-oxoacyl-[acyl-carrier protein] reductase n=1 Tax=Brooklawnia cerclae TaxID=349934 RepID=A0ABX0SBX3_9ACTN|nr:SDR family NAD(P)-dependent oxidoreductase [Brooklawnia cerclae]NIH55424.1 3-oxoacyl-[acyl-carrier protein] reductase [Brooklawnia cerclae]